MTICPKCQYQRTEQDHAPEWQCPGCGVAYNKVRPSNEEIDARNAVVLARKRAAAEKEKSRSPLAAIGIGLLVVFIVLMTWRGARLRAHDDAAQLLEVADTSPALSVHDYSLPGFQGLPWGSGNEAILRTFPGRASRMAQPEQYYNSHADVAIDHYNLEGVVMQAVFQMDNRSSLLDRVMLKKYAGAMPVQQFRQNYNFLLTALTRKLGPPKHKGEFAYVWKTGDCRIELDYLYQENIMESLTVGFSSTSGR